MRDPVQAIIDFNAHFDRESLQRNQSVFDRDQSCFYRIAWQLILAHNGGRGTTFQRLGYEVVPIKVFAFHREEKVTRLHGAGIDGVGRGNGLVVKLAGG